MRTQTPTRQRGVALIVGLVILVVLALLGASAYSVATQDERIAGNARDRARATDAAETVLRECEAYIMNNAPTFDGSVPGMLAAPAIGAPWLGENMATWPTGGNQVYVLPTAKRPGRSAAGWSNWPVCLAEGFQLSPSDIGPAPGGLAKQSQVPVRVAHVTAHGWGLNPNTQVTLVSYISY